jgi:thiol:disulfide interchange protein
VKWLAVVHTIFGFALLAVAGWWASATLRILPHMSTGTTLTNLPIVGMLALTFSAPLIALGVWMLALGRAVRRQDPGVRLRLLKTHSVLLVLSLAAMAVGIAELWAAERSAQHGGGLLGGIGLVPLGLGGCLAAVNVVALAGAIATREPRVLRGDA